MKFTILAMENNKRACVAAVIAAISCRKNISSVYDFGKGQYFMYSTNINGRNISVYDYLRGGYIQGSLDQVYDYVSGSYISLHVNGNTFNGYDYERGFYFNGQISNGGISFFDYEMALYYNYSFS